MQPDLHEQFYTIYLLDIFAALNILNLEIHECHRHIIVFRFQGQNKVVADMNTYPKYDIFLYFQWND